MSKSYLNVIALLLHLLPVSTAAAAGAFSLDDPLDVFPDSFSVTQGSLLAGDLGDLYESDNSNVIIKRTSPNGTEFIVKGVSPVESPSSLEITLEGGVTAARGDATQWIWLRNYNTASWELVHLGVANEGAQSVVSISMLGDVSRFVQAGTNCLEARIRYTNNRDRSQYESGTDQFFWSVDF